MTKEQGTLVVGSVFVHCTECGFSYAGGEWGFAKKIAEQHYKLTGHHMICEGRFEYGHMPENVKSCNTCSGRARVCDNTKAHECLTHNKKDWKPRSLL